MAGHTLSGYADEQTYRRVTELAKAEDRSAAQIVAAAVRLYTRLPRRAHEALRRLEAAGPEVAEAAAWAAGRALLDQQYEAAVAKGLVGSAGAPADDDEAEILARAVEMTRRPA